MKPYAIDWCAGYAIRVMQRRLLAEVDLSLKKAFQLIQGMEATKNADKMQ